jgi:hypothetical protein
MSSANGDAETTTGLLDSDSFMRPFLDILKDSSSSSSMNISTVRSLALKVFAHPQIFCGFDEFKSSCLLLLEGDSGGSGASQSLFHTLDLFSFGTLKDYTNRTEKDYYLPLNEPALAKLSQLTVLTCIQTACFHGETSISYDSLAEALGSASSAGAMQEEGSMANNRDIEDVLVRCVYADVLKGKLCQKTRSFGWRGERLPVVLSRDVSPDRIPDLLLALEGLGQRLEESGKDVAEAQEHVTQGLEETAQFWMSLQSQKKLSLGGGDAKGSVGVGVPSGVGQPRFFAGGRQGPGGFAGPSGSGPTFGTGASQGMNNPRRSSKRSRGGMAGSFLADTSGFRM